MCGYLALSVDLDGLDQVDARVEAAEAACFAAGALSVTLTDAVDDAILEPAPGEVRLWPHTVLQALFPAEYRRTRIHHRRWPARWTCRPSASASNAWPTASGNASG